MAVADGVAVVIRRAAGAAERGDEAGRAQVADVHRVDGGAQVVDLDLIELIVNDDVAPIRARPAGMDVPRVRVCGARPDARAGICR